MKLAPAIAGLALVLAVPALAFAQAPPPAACSAPVAPAVPDGAAATMEQMVAAQGQIKAFIAASDAYQECEVQAVTAQREAAKAAKAKFNESIAKDAQKRISANQKAKESAGASFSAALKAYKAAHPA